jgi:hypothetical protein
MLLAVASPHGRLLSAAILEMLVSDRGTFEGLTQFGYLDSVAVADSKDGEMSEWLKEHARKTNPPTLTE